MEIKNNETLNRDFKGVWISKEIWLDKRLNALDKIILTEIDSLCSDEKGCYASNDYIAEFCQCSKTKVSTAISKLIKLGYLYVYSFDGRQRVLKSCLSNFERHPFKKCKAPIQNLKDINIINNKEINNKKVSKKERGDNKKPRTENLCTDNQCTENMPQLNTNKQNTKELNTKDIKKVSKACEDEKPAPDKNKSFDSIIDDYTENEDLRSELKEHLKTRKSKKAAMTNRAIELSLEKLDKLSNNDAEKIRIVQNAIMNGWTTFYPLKDEQSSKITTGNSPRKNYDFGLGANYDLDLYESYYDDI